MTQTSHELWIVVRNWERFQHYGNRRPGWIKTYTALLHDHNYRSLSGRHRGLLHGIWLLYAANNRELPASPAKIASALGLTSEWIQRRQREEAVENMRIGRVDGELMVSRGRVDGESTVRMRDLKRLEQAGFIELVASKPLASRARSREREKNKDKVKDTQSQEQSVSYDFRRTPSRAQGTDEELIHSEERQESWNSETLG
jgi:hypothetical protein